MGHVDGPRLRVREPPGMVSRALNLGIATGIHRSIRGRDWEGRRLLFEWRVGTTTASFGGAVRGIGLSQELLTLLGVDLRPFIESRIVDGHGRRNGERFRETKVFRSERPRTA